MEIETAIKTAMEYETRIRDLYQEAARVTRDPVGKKIFGLLAQDEQHHLDYLTHKLTQWRESGRVTAEGLAIRLPSREILQAEMKKLHTRMADEDRNDEKQMLSKALSVEVDTSRFYRDMVNTLGGEAQQLFTRFLEIEDEHIALVQAELDYVSHSGYWMDVKEFDMEDM